MKQKKGNGLSVPVILFLIFLVMKLAGIGKVAEWSWVWVFSPLWLLIIFIVVVAVIGATIEQIMEDNRK